MISATGIIRSQRWEIMAECCSKPVCSAKVIPRDPGETRLPMSR
jgi:hypothetical protein